MTNHDPVEGVIQSFLDYLEGSGPEPTLDHLDPEERKRAEELMESLRAGRGINPYASRPSLEQLLVGTEFEEALRGAQREPASTPSSSSNELLEAIKSELGTYAEMQLEVSRDLAAADSGVMSHFLIQAGPHRLRVRVVSELDSSAQLVTLDPAEIAGSIYGRYPDTAGVLAMYPDDELSSIAIDPFDSVFCIEVPHGAVAKPSTRRPLLPLGDALRSYLEELAPRLESLTQADALTTLELDLRSLADSVTRQAVDAVVQEGSRAKIDAKKKGLTSFTENDLLGIAGLVVRAQQGPLSEEDLRGQVKELSEAA
jgi:hypothetical protein